MRISEIDRWCDLYEERLQAGEKITAQEFIQANALPQDAQLLAELQRVEQEYRTEVAPEVPADGGRHAQTVPMPPEKSTRETIGPYKLLQKLGEGGMGVVYMAEQSRPVSRRVALKVIKPGMDSKQVLARFEAERQALALMDHPNIARVLDAGLTEDGRPYFVMELVKGIPITKYCDEKRLSPRERLELFVPICQAVQHAHHKGVIHRDLKPSNVLVAELDGKPVPKIIDFGLAKAISQRLTEETVFTEIGQIVGTIDYMSPEQATTNQLDVDTRTDVYSLGVLLYELLTGETPFDRKRLHQAAFDELLRIIRQEEPPRPSTRLSSHTSLPSIAAARRTEPKKLSFLVRGELDWIVMKALEKDRGRRYETANAFALDIQRFLADEPVAAGPPSVKYKIRKFISRYRTAVLTTCAMVLLVVCFSAFSGFMWWRTHQSELALDTANDQLTNANGELDDRNQQLDENIRALAQSNLELIAANQRERDQNNAIRRLAARSLFDHGEVEFSEERVLSATQDLLCAWTIAPVDDPLRSSYLQVLVDRVTQGNRQIAPPMRHESWVMHVAFSPDGEQLATASHDGTARLWDAHSVVPLGEPMRHESWVRHVAFSPDGEQLATASHDRTARLWDARTGAPLGEPMRHASSVLHVAFSSDGERIATASDDGTARLWDAHSGTPLSEPMRHEGEVRHVAFSPDGERIATASADGTARLWDAHSGTPLGEPMRHEREVLHVAFSPDGERIATASYDGTARLWDAHSGMPLGEPMRHEREVLYVAFSPDGERLATTSADGTTRLWDAHSGMPLGEPLRHGSWVYHVAFSPDGEQIATASEDSTARLWDAHSGMPLAEPMRHEGRVEYVAFSPDGERIATASWDDTARLWDAHSGAPLGEPMRHEREVLHVAFSPDGERLATTSGDGTTRLWDAHSGAPLSEPMRHGGCVQHVAFSPDGERLATACLDSTARLWDARTGAPLGEPLRHEGSIYYVAFSPDGERIATASVDGTARLWDAHSGMPLGEPIRHGGWVYHVAFSPDGEQIATASEDSTARLWDAHSGMPLAEPMRHEREVRHVAFSPDGERIATASWDGTARLWDAHSGMPLGEPLRHESWVNHVAFSPDGERLATASSDGTARLWDVRFPELDTIPEDQLRVLLQIWAGWSIDDAGNTRPLYADEAQELRRALRVPDPLADW